MCSENVDFTLKELDAVVKYILKFLKANADKCHLFLRTDEFFLINVDNEVIKSSNDKKLLGVNLDSRLRLGFLCNRYL